MVEPRPICRSLTDRTLSRAFMCLLGAGLAASLAGCSSADTETGGAGAIVDAPATPGGSAATGQKVLRLPIRTDGPKSLDPVRSSTTYDNMAQVNMYETLLQHKYLVRPPTIEPLMLSEMPSISDDGLTYQFKLKPGVRFADDGCFADGKGRPVTPEDVFYSWKRMADQSLNPKGWWLFKDTIAGFDEYRAEQNAAAKFDYDAPVTGFRVVNNREFEVVLKRPVYRFMWLLTMFQTSVVAREAVETYGDTFGRHPVGTGPFILESWEPGKSMAIVKNPNYHESYYPSEYMPEDEAMGLHLAAGQKLPIVDRVEFTMYVQDQPMWLQFNAGNIGYTQVPHEYFTEAYVKRTRKLRPKYTDKGVVSHAVPLLDFIFRGFNMEDELVGGYTDKKRALRKAIALAEDLDERNESFYSGTNIIYDGMIPPALEGHPDGHRMTGPLSMAHDLDKARELLAEAGYPEGKGLPPIEFYINRGANNPEQSELFARQLQKIGVQLNIRLVDFSQMMEAVDNKKAQMFSFAWSSDYPDGENNLALFYGPNEAPGSNNYNYKRPEYDEMYKQIQVMAPSPERTAMYVKMRDMVLADAPYSGSMARTRYYLVNPWLKNLKPSEDSYNWVKYLDIAE